MVTTPTKSARIWQLRKSENLSLREIQDRTGIPNSTISRELKRLEASDGNFYEARNYKGRKPLMSPHDVWMAKQAILGGQCTTAAEVACKLFPDVDPRRVGEALSKIGLKAYARVKWPLLSKTHVWKRKKWWRKYWDFTPDEWAAIVFSDETKINLWGSDGRQYCRRYLGQALRRQYVLPTVKHGGGSLMVWGCVSYLGVGRLHRIDGTMNAKMYTSILRRDFLGTLRDYGVDRSEVIFQQDNDPKHMAQLTKAWFDEANITVLDWAPQSPDMNIIEHVWYRLKHRISTRKRRPCNLEELWKVIQEEWEAITPEEIQHLYHSMPRRIEALGKARGWYTKY